METPTPCRCPGRIRGSRPRQPGAPRLPGRAGRDRRDAQMAIVHIYSEAPAYRWVDASGEGITALDDIARAALVYLELGRRRREGPALERARLLLETVMYLQTQDGEYHNFLRDRDRDDQQGRTDQLRGLGLVGGPRPASACPRIRRLPNARPGVRGAAPRCLRDSARERSSERWERSPRWRSSLHGVRQPSWPAQGRHRLSSLALLGLTEWYEASRTTATRRLAFRLGQAVAESRAGDGLTYPFGLRPSTTSSTAFWHAWGGHTVEALAAPAALRA